VCVCAVFNNKNEKTYKLQLQCAPVGLEVSAFECFSAFPIFWLITNFTFVTTGRRKMTRFLIGIKNLPQIIVKYSKLPLKVVNGGTFS